MKDRERFVRRLYPVFAANLELYLPEYKGCFLCPLCLRLWTDLDSAIPYLSEAHIVPQKLGGKASTLTCERCNNTVGTKIEGEEAKRLDDYRRIKGAEGLGRRVKTVLGAEGEDLPPLEVYVSERSADGKTWLNLHIEADKNNPRTAAQALKLIRDALEGGKFPLQVRMSTENPFDSHRADLTYLCIAYLRMFHEMGYEWVFSSVAKAIRDQIQQPEVRLLEACIYTTNELPSDEFAFTIVKSPEKFRGFFLPMPFIERDPRPGILWLPAFLEAYPETIPDELEGQRCDTTLCGPSHQFLGEPSSRFYWHRYLYPDYEMSVAREPRTC